MLKGWPGVGVRPRAVDQHLLQAVLESSGLPLLPLLVLFPLQLSPPLLNPCPYPTGQDHPEEEPQENPA